MCHHVRRSRAQTPQFHDGEQAVPEVRQFPRRRLHYDKPSRWQHCGKMANRRVRTHFTPRCEVKTYCASIACLVVELRAAVTSPKMPKQWFIIRGTLRFASLTSLSNSSAVSIHTDERRFERSTHAQLEQVRHISSIQRACLETAPVASTVHNKNKLKTKTWLQLLHVFLVKRSASYLSPVWVVCHLTAGLSQPCRDFLPQFKSRHWINS